MMQTEELTIRLLSDDLLYQEAVRFAENKNVRPAQINGLLAFSKGEWSELEKFINHQANRTAHHAKEFYVELKTKLQWLRKQAQETGLIPDGLTKQEAKACVDALAVGLAREFIQHLSAELLCRKGGQ